MPGSHQVIVAWIDAHGPIVVTEQQLREANPCRLRQSYDGDSRTWTFTVDAPAPTAASTD
jgi:hypothetical protein